MDNKMRTRIMKQAMTLYERGITISDIIKILPKLYPEKSSENVKMCIETSIEMTKSLMIATNQAGGGGWLTSTLCKMTVLDLISTLAPNRVRFIYIDKNKKIGMRRISKSLPLKCKYCKKIDEIKTFAENMIRDFKRHLKEDDSNIVAGFGIDIYKEIIEKLK